MSSPPQDAWQRVAANGALAERTIAQHSGAKATQRLGRSSRSTGHATPTRMLFHESVLLEKTGPRHDGDSGQREAQYENEGPQRA